MVRCRNDSSVCFLSHGHCSRSSSIIVSKRLRACNCSALECRGLKAMRFVFRFFGKRRFWYSLLFLQLRVLPKRPLELSVFQQILEFLSLPFSLQGHLLFFHLKNPSYHFLAGYCTTV